MKKLTFITCLVLLPLALQAQEDRYDQLTNPKLTSINKEAPRSTFTSYATEEDAIVNDRTNGASRLSLNGKWKFNYVENFADRPTDFMNVRTEVNRWPDINVPGNWELQGFGTPKTIIAICLSQFFVMYPCFFFQSIADMVQSYGLFVMFHRIWCTSNAIAPPVIDGTSIHRCILHFIPDLVIQFLKRHHMHGDFFAIFFIKQRNRICNGRVYGRIIRKNAGNTGDIETGPSNT